MHPPFFLHHHRLSDWPNCWLHTQCKSCGRQAAGAIRMILRERGDTTFVELLPRLRCLQCRARPAPVFLCASAHRSWCGGPKPDWSLELVPPPRA